MEVKLLTDEDYLEWLIEENSASCEEDFLSDEDECGEIGWHFCSVATSGDERRLVVKDRKLCQYCLLTLRSTCRNKNLDGHHRFLCSLPVCKPLIANTIKSIEEEPGTLRHDRREAGV
ncbi:unnamed protein product [Heligmosomoides polygyrus]|uniref:TRAF-type domain-containing protein n=1 Tax=Heligmosomoides polygyrus TaxID=6339 RepID=A0A183FYR9_HELPZ|nr:unnamed protein product [Heligmosomoides polygyrus]